MWKRIPDWEWYVVNENGDVKNTKTNNVICGDVNNAGYHRICVYDAGKSKHLFRHRLVASLFLDNPDDLPEVNHKDGNKDNNNVSNLEWSNRIHNEHEARRIGIKEYKPYSVLFSDGRYKEYEFAIELANEIGVSKRTVLNYLHGKSCGYINKGIELIQYLK